MAIVQNTQIFIDHLTLTQGVPVTSERGYGWTLSDSVSHRVSLLKYFVGYRTTPVVFHGSVDPLLVQACPSKAYGPSFFEVVDRYPVPTGFQRITISTEPSDRPGHIHAPEGLGLDTIRQALLALGDCPPASLVAKWLSMTPPDKWGEGFGNSLFYAESLTLAFIGEGAARCDYPSGLDYESFYRACTLEGWAYFRQTGEWNSYDVPTISSVEEVELSSVSSTVFTPKGSI